MKAFSVFNETLSPTSDNTFSPTHIASLNAFKKVVKERFDGFDFDARHDATSQDEPMAVADVFSDIYTAIELAESWVLRFKAEFSDKLVKERNGLEQEWADARKEMFNPLEEYPRDVGQHTFYVEFDKRFGHPTGRTKEFTEPSPLLRMKP